MKSARRWITWIVILIGLPAAGMWLWRARQVQAKADLPVAELRQFSPLVGADVHDVLTLEGSVASRSHPGGTAPAAPCA